MARVFLSYAREDFGKAQLIAKALEAAGHSVWWDKQLHPGERFSAEIDRALKNSDAVIALWSKASIESAWVQDEAGVGRDSGRLVPALLEPVTPPLGFRQYHAVDLSGRRLDTRSTQPLVQAVDDRLSGKYTKPQGQVRSALRPSPRIIIALAALAFIFATAAGWWSLRSKGLSASPSIMIEPAENSSPVAELLARSIADDLRRFRAGPLAGLDVLQTGGRSANYHARVGVTESPSTVTLELSLASRRAPNLWSASLEGPSSQGAELNRQAAAMLGAALQCDLDVEKRRYSLTTEVRVLYIDGCTRLADTRTSRNEAINALRQVTQKAPRFAPAWAKLAYAEFSGIDFVPESERSNLAWTAGRHNQTARSLDPNIPEYFYVHAFNGPWTADTRSDRLQIVDEGLHKNPDSALLHAARAEMLMGVGRINEALESAKRARDLNPLSPELIGYTVLGYAYAGQPKAAERELKTAEETWPRSATIAELRYRFDLRYGDPANALRMVRENEVPDLALDQRTELFLRARINPTSANIDPALQSYRQAFRKDWWNVTVYVQALAEFGRVDEAYHAIAAAPAEPWYRSGEILFRPFMNAIRSDPRFMQVAYRAGLLSYWKKSGAWPDFCKDPQLPYDCREEAKKYPLEPPLA